MNGVLRALGLGTIVAFGLIGLGWDGAGRVGLRLVLVSLGLKYLYDCLVDCVCLGGMIDGVMWMNGMG